MLTDSDSKESLSSESFFLVFYLDFLGRNLTLSSTVSTVTSSPAEDGALISLSLFLRVCLSLPPLFSIFTEHPLLPNTTSTGDVVLERIISELEGTE